MADYLHLRQQAERCLRLAAQCSPKISDMLRGFAADYLERAEQAASAQAEAAGPAAAALGAASDHRRRA